MPLRLYILLNEAVYLFQKCLKQRYRIRLPHFSIQKKEQLIELLSVSMCVLKHAAHGGGVGVDLKAADASFFRQKNHKTANTPLWIGEIFHLFTKRFAKQPP
ncbi:hypothetical protein [Bartonella tribocorum]|uniref:hypothetical protein n=1 Tax=Bartonella tribocorum TaxID=85701 RepID=UPI000A9F132C|nr:hypothetical protein [Bartonella tribocorum]